MNERIRLLREALGMSRAAFGESLGVSGDVINNIERGRLNKPEQKLSLIKLMCKEFNVNEEWMQTGEGEMFLQQTQDEKLAAFFGEVNLTDEGDFRKRFLSALSELDPDGWKVIENLMKKCMHEENDLD